MAYASPQSKTLQLLTQSQVPCDASLVNVVGVIVIYLCYFVGAICTKVLGDRFWSNTKGLPLALLYFPLVVSLLCTSSSFFTLFVSYELLLVPSLFVVYKSCYTRRAQQANIYFFIWTQVGSLVAFCPVLYLVFIYKNAGFTFLSELQFTDLESWVIFLLFFFGFGVKVPVWPLHYWLIKIHVEAPSGFSIFLSGFLVKTGIYCFFVTTAVLNSQHDYVFPIFLCIIGILDSTLKFWGQEDIKKLIAYATVQEMNIIYLLFCLNNSESISFGCVFLIAHGILSSLLFFIVECVYRRVGTRSISKISGLSTLYPNLGVAVWAMLILFLGFPGTLKFYVELKFIFLLSQLDLFVSFLTVFTLIFVGSIGFARCWLSLLYGMPSTATTVDDNSTIPGNGPYPSIDLSRPELLLISLLVFLSFAFCFVPYLIL